jgi:hypothetical protein
VLGVPPSAVIEADPLYRELLLDVAETARQTADLRDQNQAVRIINALAEALKRR